MWWGVSDVCLCSAKVPGGSRGSSPPLLWCRCSGAWLSGDIAEGSPALTRAVLPVASCGSVGREPGSSADPQH